MNEAELSVQLVSFSIRNETDIAALRNICFKIRHDLAHDHLSDPLTLMVLEYGDVDDLVETASVADNASHANRAVAIEYLHGKQRSGKPALSGLDRLLAEAGTGSKRSIRFN